MATVLNLAKDVMRGVVRISGKGIPNGVSALVTRQADRIPEPIRGGDLVVSTGGFLLEDPEPPFGADLTYRVTISPLIRNIQTNRVLNPKAKNDLNNWLTGINRTLTRDAAPAPVIPRDATTAIKVSPNSGGMGVRTIDDRILASTVPLGMAPGRWLLTGQAMYDSPDAWLWLDAKNNGTWSALRDKGTWSAVRGAEALEASQPFASIWATVISPTKTQQTIRTNRILNPLPASSSGWSFISNFGTGGVGTATYFSPGSSNTAAPGGNMRYQWSTLPTAADYALSYDGRNASSMKIAVTPGEVLSYAQQMNAVFATNRPLDQTPVHRAGLVFYDAAGNVVSTVYGPNITTRGGLDARVMVENVTVPVGATNVCPTIFGVANPPVATDTAPPYIDTYRAILESGPTVGAYFDGSFTNTGRTIYGWAGTANISVSNTSVLDYTTTVAPFQVIGASVLAQNRWLTFQAWIDIPANGFPAGSRLAFLHGPADREYATTFWLTTLMVTPEAEAGAGAVLPYFDGDTVLPVNPAANLLPGYDWFDVSKDASMAWSGTPNGSSSVYTGPSVVAAEAMTHIDAPSLSQLPKHRLPIMLSDPILPQVNTWFELMEIGDLGFAARQDLYDVINRGPRIAVSSARAWPEGEFRLMTYTLEAASIAERMFAPGRILFVRNPDPDFPESNWYLAIGNVNQGRLNPKAAKKPERLWQVPFVRVERPVGLIAAASGVTWAQIKAAYTWDSLRRTPADWLDAAVTAP